MFQEIALTLMQDKKIRKALGTTIRGLRNQRGWTQKELAGKVGIPQALLTRYETGVHAPPVEKLLLLAELFGVSIDYLVTGNHRDETPLHNRMLLERFRALEKFPPKDRETVVTLIDAMILRRRMHATIKSLDH